MRSTSDRDVAARANARASTVSASMLTKSISPLPTRARMIDSHGAREGPKPIADCSSLYGDPGGIGRPLPCLTFLLAESNRLTDRDHETPCRIHSVTAVTHGTPRPCLPQSDQVANGVLHDSRDRVLSPLVSTDHLARHVQPRRQLLLRQAKPAPGGFQLRATHERRECTT